MTWDYYAVYADGTVNCLVRCILTNEEILPLKLAINGCNRAKTSLQTSINCRDYVFTFLYYALHTEAFVFFVYCKTWQMCLVVQFDQFSNRWITKSQGILM